MSVLLSVFNKPVDIEAVFKSWENAPIFRGKPRRDEPINVWLERIKDGCKERKVPKSMWHLVGEHYLHSRAKKRFKAVQAVMANRYGGKYTWDWKRFKIAMTNMQWELDSNLVQTFLVRAMDNVAWILGPSTASSTKEVDDKVYVAIEKLEQPYLLKAFKSLTKSTSTFLYSGKEDASTPAGKSSSKEVKTVTKDSKSTPKDATPPSKGTKIDSKDNKTTSKESKPTPKDAKKTPATGSTPSKPSKITWKDPHKLLVKRNPAEKDPAGMSTDILPLIKLTLDELIDVSYSQAPMWLLQVCHVLDNASPDSQGAMTILSAILITVGSIPALPVIQSGAAGVFLASGAAQTIGSILTGFGAWLGMHAEHDHEHPHHAKDSSSHKK